MHFFQVYLIYFCFDLIIWLLFATFLRSTWELVNQRDSIIKYLTLWKTIFYSICKISILEYEYIIPISVIVTNNKHQKNMISRLRKNGLEKYIHVQHMLPASSRAFWFINSNALPLFSRKCISISTYRLCNFIDFINSKHFLYFFVIENTFSPFPKLKNNLFWFLTTFVQILQSDQLENVSPDENHSQRLFATFQIDV